MSVVYSTVYSTPVTPPPRWELREGVLRVLDSCLLAKDPAGLSASKPTINRLAEVVPRTRRTWLHDGVVIGAEWSADAVSTG
jgi:hypothetical protein